MVVIELLEAVTTLGIEQLLQSRYGALGVLCLILVGIGLKARNTPCLATGAVIFALLMTQA